MRHRKPRSFSPGFCGLEDRVVLSGSGLPNAPPPDNQPPPPPPGDVNPTPPSPGTSGDASGQASSQGGSGWYNGNGS